VEEKIKKCLLFFGTLMMIICSFFLKCFCRFLGHHSVEEHLKVGSWMTIQMEAKKVLIFKNNFNKLNQK